MFPPGEAEHITLHVGWFEHTLPGFLAEHPGPAALIHLDCDLYSSAHYVLTELERAGRLVAGTVVVFDELLNYCGFERHEFRALFEHVERFARPYEWLGVQHKGCMKAALVFTA